MPSALVSARRLRLEADPDTQAQLRRLVRAEPGPAPGCLNRSSAQHLLEGAGAECAAQYFLDELRPQAVAEYVHSLFRHRNTQR